MGDDDQSYLSQIEENIRSKGNEQADAQKEAEQRAEEMERIRKASANLPGPGNTTPAAGNKNVNPLENDPRYKEYFERLRKQKGEKPAGATPTPAAGIQQAKASAASAQKVGPGSIVRFDDGSIGVYKDAVSGKDYALFYFLNPDGEFLPEGVFLQCYQAKVIGSLPEEHFATLRDDGSWNRDMIVFHLAKFEFVDDLNKLAEHQERKPSKTPLRNVAVQPQSQPDAQPQVTNEAAPQQPASPPASDSQPEPTTSAPTPPPGEPSLVKGRRFQIRFGGKQWEAVYWASEGENSIVAHDTHGTWSLMRLDLNRFKESLELLDVVDSDTQDAIAQQAVAEK